MQITITFDPTDALSVRKAQDVCLNFAKAISVPSPQAPGNAPALAKASVASSAPVAAPPAPVVAAIDYNAVKTAVVAYSRKASQADAAKLLASFGVERGPDLKPEQYGAVVEAFNNALAAL